MSLLVLMVLGQRNVQHSCTGNLIQFTGLAPTRIPSCIVMYKLMRICVCFESRCTMLYCSMQNITE